MSSSRVGAAGAAAARWLFPVGVVIHDTRWWTLEVKRSIKLMESYWTWLAWGEVSEAAINSLVSGSLGWVKFSPEFLSWLTCLYNVTSGVVSLDCHGGVTSWQEASSLASNSQLWFLQMMLLGWLQLTSSSHCSSSQLSVSEDVSWARCFRHVLSDECTRADPDHAGEITWPKNTSVLMYEHQIGPL